MTVWIIEYASEIQAPPEPALYSIVAVFSVEEEAKAFMVDLAKYWKGRFVIMEHDVLTSEIFDEAAAP